MHVFFQCVAEAVAEKGIRGVVAELVPGGGYMFDIAKSAWEKYSKKREMKQIRDDVQKMAQANFEEAKKAAIEAANQAARNQPEIIAVLETFLAQIPAATRQSLKRADDPTGTTVPANFSLRGPEDVAKLLPTSLPRFKPGDPLPGKAGWLLEKQLGIGGFGEVWLARKSGYESLLGAVKFCRSLDTRDRDLLHESKVIDQLLKHGDHPNIVKLMDVHLEGDAPWLIYEYVEGGDLTDLIHQWSALPPSDRQQRALAALQELAAAIGHFHRLDPAIVHRDLKPANILRDKSGRLRITDFGISGIAAKHMIENETRGVTTRAGRLQSYLYGSYTPLYASPQQKDGAAPDPRDDVHALGVIGYQMLTGQVSQGVGSDLVEDLRDSRLCESMINLFQRCTAQKAERRFETAAAFADAIKTATTGRQVDLNSCFVPQGHSESYEIHFQRAEAARKDGEHDKAIVEYTEVIRLNPGVAEAYFGRGVSLYQQYVQRRTANGVFSYSKDDIDRFIADFSDAIRLNPTWAEAYLERAQLRYKCAYYPAAISDASQAIQLNPNLDRAFLLRAYCYSSSDSFQPKLAIADYTNAIRINPKVYWNYRNRGQLHERLGNLDEAIADFSKTIELCPEKDRYAYYWERAEFFERVGLISRALADYSQVLRIVPHHIGARESLVRLTQSAPTPRQGHGAPPASTGGGVTLSMVGAALLIFIIAAFVALAVLR